VSVIFRPSFFWEISMSIMNPNGDDVALIELARDGETGAPGDVLSHGRM
jgi:hypothetical protein